MEKESRLPSLALTLVFAAMLSVLAAYHPWIRNSPDQRGVIKWDVISYYAYLPATFIYGDLSLKFLDKPPEGFVNDGKFWYTRAENGNRLIQTSMGLSILYSPFFFTAHLLAPLTGQPADGFSSIYQLFLTLSSLFYVMLGLVFLRRILLKWFSPAITALTLLLVGLGTNLFYYTVHEGPMSHAYNFALITLFLWLTIRWYEHSSWKYSMMLGLVYGLIVLIRPSNVIAGILFMFWGVSSWRGLRERLLYLMGRFRFLLAVACCFLLVWIPQLIYWKLITGHFLYNSYGPSGSSFYPFQPHIPEVLFSYRKGWYVYTPLMFLATLSLLFSGKWLKEGILAILLYLMVHIYLISSWWSWWNGGSFGHRSFVDIYGVLALPLAVLLKFLGKQRKLILLGGMLVLTFLLFLNQFQTYQYTKQVIHYTGMTREAYWLNFMRFKPSGAYWHMLSIPDSQLARLGIYYDYYTGNKDAELKAMDEDQGKSLVREELLGDRKLMRQIDRHAKRSEQSREKVLNVVVERIYDYRISH